MTDKKTEALKLALEALEWIAAQRTGGMIERKAMEAITALREALVEQPAQQEPVTDNTYNYAKSLAEAIFKQHFASDEHYASGRIVWGVNDTVIGILTQIDNMAADMVRRPAQHEPLGGVWYTGYPPFPQDQEWFIAETIYGDRVVLKSLDEGREHEGIYAFTTADGTYMKGEIISRWMQFPDCEYAPPKQQEPVAKDWSVFNTGAEVWSGLSMADAVSELTPERIERGWSAVCVINKNNPPFYTSPPASKPWVGLTNAEIAELKILPGANRERTATEMAFAVRDKLKEKNT